jgi:hypothetical protein
MQCSCASISRNRRCPDTEQRGGNAHSGRSRCSCSISTGLSQRTPSSAVLVALKRQTPMGGGWLRGPMPAITCERCYGDSEGHFRRFPHTASNDCITCHMPARAARISPTLRTSSPISVIHPSPDHERCQRIDQLKDQWVKYTARRFRVRRTLLQQSTFTPPDIRLPSDQNISLRGGRG